MIGPALYLWMMAQQPKPEASWSFSAAYAIPLSVPEIVMTIPLSKGRHQLPVYFERRGNQRCVLLYTFSTDEKNYERIVICTAPGGDQGILYIGTDGKTYKPDGPGRQRWTSVECAGKGCEP